MIIQRDPVNLELSDPRLHVAVPTAGDLIEMESRKDRADLILWYLVRFLVDDEGRPFLRTEEEARQVPASVAKAVIERVGQLAEARP